MRSLILRIAIVVLGGMIGIFLTWKEGFSTSLEVREEARFATGPLESLRFARDNRLVAVRRSDALVRLEVWETGRESVNRMQFLVLLEGDSTGVPVWGLSDDLDWVAWIDGRRLHLKELTSRKDPRRMECPVESGGARTLAVLPGERIWVGRANGTYTVVEMKGCHTTAQGDAGIGAVAAYAVAGEYAAAVSASMRDTRVLDLRRPESVSVYAGRTWLTPAKRLVLDRTGKLALLTLDGQILVPGEGALEKALSAPGPIRYAAPVPGGGWLAVGEFAGVYELQVDAKPRQIASASFHTVELAAGNGVQIALHAGEDTVLLGLHEIPLYRKPLIWFPVAWIAVFVAGALAYNLIRGKLWNRILALLRKYHWMEEPAKACPVPDPPAALVEALRAGNCFLYVGTGLAAQSGRPVWREFLKSVVEWSVDARLIRPKQAIPLSKQLMDGPVEGVFELIADVCGDIRTGIHHLIRRTYWMTAADLSPSHLALGRLPFAGAIVSSPDEGVEMMFADRRGPVYGTGDGAALKRAVTLRQFFVLKPYGSMAQPDTLKLGVAEFGRSLESNYLFHEAMNEVFLKKTVLFLGTSMEGLSMDVRNIVFERSAPEQHFALVPVEGKEWEAAALGLAERWGIQVLPYNPTAGHAEFAEFVSRLTGAVAGTVGGATDAAAAGAGKDA